MSSVPEFNQITRQIFGDRTSEVTGLFYLAKELGCLADIIGREYEVRNKEGDLIYTIIQKPMTVPQLNIMLEELLEHNKREQKEMNKAKHRGRR